MHEKHSRGIASGEDLRKLEVNIIKGHMLKTKKERNKQTKQNTIFEKYRDNSYKI